MFINSKNVLFNKRVTNFGTMKMIVPFDDNLEFHDGLHASFEIFTKSISPSPVMTGIFGYIVGLILLLLWEEYVLPILQDNAILPILSDQKYKITRKERKQKWITPLTADRRVPLPTLEDLQNKDHKVGSFGNVYQYISSDTTKSYKQNIREYSPEWSIFYNNTIVIYKKKC